MAFRDSNLALSSSELRLQRLRESAGLTRQQLVDLLKTQTHCEECRSEYDTLSSRTVARRENWSPIFLESDSNHRQNTEASRPSAHYLVHLGNVVGLRSKTSIDELLVWAKYVPEAVWTNVGQDGIELDEVPIESDQRPPQTVDAEPEMKLSELSERNLDKQPGESGATSSVGALATADDEGGLENPSTKSEGFKNWILHWVADWPYSDEPGETFPFGISLLLLQCSMLLGGFVTGLDPFGLQRWLPHLAGTATLIVLAFAIFVFISIVATLLFFLLRNRKGGARHVYPRAVWQVFPPLVLAYTPLLVFASIGSAVFNLGVFAVYGGMFTAIVAFRDAEFGFPSWKIRSLVNLVLASVLITATAYTAVVSIAYLAPNPIFGVHESLFLDSWMIEFDSLGYTEDELIERIRLGGLMSHIAAGMCLSGVAAYLLRTVYVLEPDDSR